jgi:hypothetical protein
MPTVTRVRAQRRSSPLQPLCHRSSALYSTFGFTAVFLHHTAEEYPKVVREASF